MTSLCKCIVWDLDNTVWDGICLEGHVVPRQETLHAIETLHSRGILHSVASRGEAEVALGVLKQQRMLDYFVVPKINWLPKSANIQDIASTLNIPLDAMAFIDDDPFEREQVEFMLPEVRVFPAESAEQLPGLPGFDTTLISDVTTQRARLYREEQERKEAEPAFSSREEFLQSCDMQLSVRTAVTKDIPRIREMMSRTHQMNSSGLMLGEEELLDVLTNGRDERELYIAELHDRFGSCGIIGITVMEKHAKEWRMLLFAMSCRVMGRGIEKAFLFALFERHLPSGVTYMTTLLRETERNRMMRTMFQMSGYRQYDRWEDGTLLLKLDDNYQLTRPSWVRLV
ncbi:HAD-IIIC family phosphatase [bacterium]|nr:HAD-IIIC family phosphatase [bacterium]